jgi:hypothetical protein
LTAGKWAIDRQNQFTIAWYGIKNNKTIDSEKLTMFDPASNKSKFARMVDHTGTNGTQVTRMGFETYVIGFSLKGGSHVYSGLAWGYELNPNGPVGLGTEVVRTTTGEIAPMSQEFIDSVTAWNKQPGKNMLMPFVDAPRS